MSQMAGNLCAETCAKENMKCLRRLLELTVYELCHHGESLLQVSVDFEAVVSRVRHGHMAI